MEIIGTALVVIGFILLLFVPIVGLLVFLNVKGIRDTLYARYTNRPGFRSKTRWKATLAGSGYLLIASFAIMLVGGIMLPPVEDPYQISEIEIDQQTLEAGDSIEVVALVTNVANETETISVNLEVSGNTVSSKDVTLNPDETRQIAFSRTFNDPGDHQVSLNGQDAGTVTVEPTPSPTPTATPSPTPTPTATPTPSPTPTPTVSPTNDEYYMGLMENALIDAGYDITSIEVADGRDEGGEKSVIISYRTSEASYSEIRSESGSFAGAFAVVVDRGWDIDTMTVVVGDQQGTAIGTFYCQKDWAERYANDEISAEELAERVLNTFTAF